MSSSRLPLRDAEVVAVLEIPLLTAAALLRRKYALVYRPRLSNQTRALKCRLRDKLYDVAHDVRSKAKNIPRRLGFDLQIWKTPAHHE